MISQREFSFVSELALYTHLKQQAQLHHEQTVEFNQNSSRISCKRFGLLVVYYFLKCDIALKY